MKKISRIAALLAAGALLFGAVGCSSGGGGSGGGDDDVTEDTVKGTYTMSGGDLASGESDTLVVVGGKIYTKVDYSLDEEEEEEEESSGGSSAPGSTTQSDVTYTLTYVNGETAHEPSYTFDKVGAALEAAQGDTFTFYIEVGTYEIANGRVTGRMIEGEDSYPARAETDDAGHLKSFTVSRSGEEPDEGGEGGDATFTFLKNIKGGSKTEAAAAGFFSGTKTGDLDITVGDIELQLYKSGTGWTVIDTSVDTTGTKAAASNNMMEGPAHIQATLTTKNDGIAHESNVFTGSGTGYEMGRVKISVTTKESAVALKKISGYFASGKSFTAGYVKAGDNDYAQITGTTALTKSSGSQTGIIVKNFEVNQTIPANSTKDVYILLGKNATSAPSAGTTIDVAEVVYEFAAANSDSTNPNPDGDGEGDKSDDNEGEEPGDPTNPSNPDEEEEDKEPVLVASITVTADKTELEAGEKATFTAVCKGADGAEPSNGEVTWSAKIGDAPAANVITATGVFTAPVHTDEDKTYTITATAKDGSGTTGTAEITVKMQEPPTIGENLEVDFTTGFEAATVCEEGSTVPVRLGDTDFFAVSGSEGKKIELKKQDNSMALNFNGGGGIGKSAVFFYAKEGTATVTVTYYQSNAGRYVKVLNEGMDTAEAADNEKTTADKTRKTRTINITIDEDLTPVYIGSASSGIYVASIKVEYKDE